MEKKTIGAFIAALRKANGMTQQELADRLGVSNKAVSRWERDENAPDLSLIPAIAEIFGVTCDELLKGERIFHNAEEPTKPEPKVDKQRKTLINRNISTYRTQIYISIALSLVGLCSMLGISLSFGRVYLGLSIMALFLIAACTLMAIGTAHMLETKRNLEPLENTDSFSWDRYNNALVNYSYAALLIAVCVVIISLWLFGCLTEFFDKLFFAIFSLDFVSLLLVTLLLLIAAGVSFKGRYAALLTGQKYVSERKKMHPAIVKLNCIQLSCAFLAYICLIIRPLFYNPVDTDSPLFDPSIIASRPYFYKILYIVLPCISIVLLLAVLILFVILLYRHKPQKNNILFYGLRNIAYLALTPVACALFDVSWEYQRETASMVRLVHFSFDNLIVLLTWLLRIFLFSFLIKILLRRKNKL